MRWVNETRCPASLSCLRRPSIDVTAIVRNEVAVGIDQLAFMYLTSMPAPPRSGCGVAPGDGAVAGSAGGGGAPPLWVVGGGLLTPVGDLGEDVRLRDPAAVAGAGDARDGDALGRGDARGDG